jgi:oligopeptide transport system permease protein
LGQTRGLQHGFEDRLQLKAQRYFYSVMAVDATGRRGPPARLAVYPEPAIALLDAQLQGLVSVELSQPSPGQTIRLPANPLGTDALGRDMLARLIHGARTSLFIGIVAPLAFVLLGVVYGALSGYLGGVVDNVMMRFADFVIALPFLLFMIVLKIAFGIGPGESGISAMLVAMLLLSWPASARLVRGQVMQLKQQPFIEAAKLSGAGSGYIIRRHMLPNILGVVLVALTFAIPSAIFTEAFLSFIGMGVVPPTPSWGAMSQDGMRSLLTHPHELLWPSLLISITVLAFNVLGDALRDALDVKLERRL